jgi:hypothetical protein
MKWTHETDSQIARASHNILAFRLTTPSGNLLADCDDDGAARIRKDTQIKPFLALKVTAHILEYYQ